MNGAISLLRLSAGKTPAICPNRLISSLKIFQRQNRCFSNAVYCPDKISSTFSGLQKLTKKGSFSPGILSSYVSNIRPFSAEASSSALMAVRASHILVKTEEEADKILAQLKDGGDFAELAGSHSQCPSKEKGGDLGWFGRGQMVPEFENACFEGGKIGEPVKVSTQFGWHVLILNKTATPPEEMSVQEFAAVLVSHGTNEALKEARVAVVDVREEDELGKASFSIPNPETNKVKSAASKNLTGSEAPPAPDSQGEGGEEKAKLAVDFVHLPMSKAGTWAPQVIEGQHLSKDHLNIIVCRSGQRSMQMAQFLTTEADFDPQFVVNLKGGIKAWSEEIDPSVPTY